MTNSLATATPVIAIMLWFYGCNASEPNPPLTGQGGDSGESSAGTDAAGSPADTPARGGKGGTAGSGSDAGGDAGMTAGDGVSGQPGVEHRGYILGPEEDDQQPITVPSSYSGILAAQALLGTDDEGDVFMMGTGVLYKYDPSFKLVWSYELNADSRLGIGPMSAAPNGEVFFGGITQTSLSGETYYSGSFDAIAGKLTSDGTIDWVHEFGAKGADEAKLTAVTPDGAVIVAGQSTGLLAGMPASAAGGVWMARYEADGTQTFLQQYEEFGDGTSIRDYANLYIDASDRAVMVGNGQVFQADAQTGEQIGRFLPNDSLGLNFTLGLNVTIDAAGTALYSWLNGTLSKFDLDGNRLWYREAEPARKVLIDAAENVFWSGDLAVGAGQHPIAVASDALYLAGFYANGYASTKTGVTLPPPTYNMYVGRYDLDGNRVWFQELVVDSAAPFVVADFLGIMLDPMENPVVAVGSFNSADGGFLFKLDQADGSLL